MMGINFNCKHQEFVEEILDGFKTIETRNTNSLNPYVGKRVGIIETGKGKATLKGFCTIKEVIDYDTKESFDGDYLRHLVSCNSNYYFKNKKYGYVLTDVEPCNPIEINTKGIVARRLEIEYV